MKDKSEEIIEKHRQAAQRREPFEQIIKIIGWFVIILMVYGFFISLTMTEEDGETSSVNDIDYQLPTEEETRNKFRNLSEQEKEQLYIESLESEWADIQAEDEAASQYRPY